MIKAGGEQKETWEMVFLCLFGLMVFINLARGVYEMVQSCRGGDR
jgi:hypothetical protein